MSAVPRSAVAYLSVVKAELRTVAHFRANLLAWILYSPLQLAIIYLLWSIVYRDTEQVGAFEFLDMIGYYLVVHFLRKVIEPVQTVNYEVWKEINEGRLDIYLARPLNFGLFVFFRSLGKPLVELALGLPFLVLFSLLLGVPLQRDPAVVGAFLSSVLAGYLILYLIQFLIGSMTFWFERIFGLRDLIFSVFMLFSGQLIPVSVLPAWVGTVSRYLPFEGIYFIPASVWAEPRVGGAVLALLGQQLLWIGVLTFAAVAVWSRGVARYASQGG